MKRHVLFALLPVLIAGPAAAHTGAGAAGLLAGLSHPLLGADHLLAMLAVGLWSGFALPGRVWLGAAVFLGAMMGGAALAWSGLALPMVEGGIALSVVVFGLLAAFARRDQAREVTLASLGAVGLFALCHGHAHAAEGSGPAAAYLMGFLLSTAGLHLAGIALARRVADGTAARQVQRLCGAAVAAAGLLTLVAG